MRSVLAEAENPKLESVQAQTPDPQRQSEQQKVLGAPMQRRCGCTPTRSWMRCHRGRSSLETEELWLVWELVRRGRVRLVGGVRQVREGNGFRAC